MNVRDVAQRLAVDGWATLEQHHEALPNDLKQEVARVQEQGRPFYELFSSPLGQQVLGDLIEMTFLRPRSDFEMYPKSAELYSIAKAERDGQNQLVVAIMTLMKAGSGPQAGAKS